MTNQQGAPEALRSIARYKIGYHTDEWGMRDSTPSGIPDRTGAWVLYKDHVAALVKAQQPATHVQNPAVIEHVAGDVSKNGPESNMTQQPAPSATKRICNTCQGTGIVKGLHNWGSGGTREEKCWNCHEAPQPTPSAAAAVGPDAFECLHEWDGLVRTSMPPRYACKHCHNFFDAPPYPSPQADSQPAPTDWYAGITEKHFDLAVHRAVQRDRAASAPADSLLEDAARWFSERDNVLHSFWVLLGEAETQADNDNNPLLKHQVEGFYRQWNALNGSALVPRWVTRAARKQGANHD